MYNDRCRRLTILDAPVAIYVNARFNFESDCLLPTATTVWGTNETQACSARGQDHSAPALDVQRVCDARAGHCTAVFELYLVIARRPHPVFKIRFRLSHSHKASKTPRQSPRDFYSRMQDIAWGAQAD